MGSVKRGRVVRDTTRGDGMVSVDGQQYLFRLQSMWKSEFAPRINMLVDVEFDDRGRLITVRAAPVDATAADQVAQAASVAKATTRQLAQEARSSAAPVVVQYAEAIGYPTLLAMFTLLLGWFYFSAVSLDLGMGGRLGVTFYQVLKFLNGHGVPGMFAAAAQGRGAGIYGFICFLCYVGVLLPWLWRDRRASYAMFAPLVFMVLVGLLVRNEISSQMSALHQNVSQFGSFGGAHGRDVAAQFADGLTTRIRNSISIGFGAWLSLAASVYLAWRGAQLARDGTEADSEPGPESGGRPVRGGAHSAR